MVLGVKTRLMLAGAVLGASLLALATANAQIDTTNPAPTTGAPSPTGIPQTTPGTSQTLPGTSPTTEPVPLEPFPDAGIGGAGSTLPPSTYPSPLGTDAGIGGSMGGSSGGFTPPSYSGGLDAGLR